NFFVAVHDVWPVVRRSRFSLSRLVDMIVDPANLFADNEGVERAGADGDAADRSHVPIDAGAPPKLQTAAGMFDRARRHIAAVVAGAQRKRQYRVLALECAVAADPFHKPMLLTALRAGSAVRRWRGSG